MLKQVFDNTVYFQVLDILKVAVPYEECEYRSSVIASMFAKGKQETLTDDKLRIMLLGDVEDDFITYGQAVTLNKVYGKAIAEMQRMF